MRSFSKTLSFLLLGDLPQQTSHNSFSQTSFLHHNFIYEYLNRVVWKWILSPVLILVDVLVITLERCWKLVLIWALVVRATNAIMILLPIQEDPQVNVLFSLISIINLTLFLICLWFSHFILLTSAPSREISLYFNEKIIRLLPLHAMILWLCYYYVHLYIKVNHVIIPARKWSYPNLNLKWCSICISIWE